jgi:hypothetical protein
MSFASIADIDQGAAGAHSGLVDVTGRIVDLMAVDIQRHVSGQMRVD